MEKKVQQALNGQINQEFYAAYLYLSAVAYFEAENLTGFATWMKKHANEEVEHAMKIFNFVNSRGGRVILEQIEKPKTDWSSPLEVVEDAYEHEKKVTKMIDDLVDMARTENDKATEIFLHWFVEEQVEEEEITSDLVEKLRMVGDNKHALLMLDSKVKDSHE